MYRDLYVEALSRIGELELDGSSLQNLIQSLQDMKVTMVSLGYNARVCVCVEIVNIFFTKSKVCVFVPTDFCQK